MESEQLGKRRRRRCAVVGCDRDTGQITRPILLNPPAGQIDEWKRAISYTGRAIKEFWICDGHFSEHQFLDERNTRLGLPLRRDKLHLKPTAVPDLSRSQDYENEQQQQHLPQLKSSRGSSRRQEDLSPAHRHASFSATTGQIRNINNEH